ncbi:MAG TPA: phosphatase PAP2 family protein [Xanthobacteraceae bacterium]|nr:phosphatase PAP2 family protein [Xanthobacteraceae bacterium]
MTATGVKHEASPPARGARRISSGLVALLALPMRPPQRRATGAPILPAARAALALIVAAALIGAAMIVLDGWVYPQQKRLPIWVINLFDEITDYGRSGWFLWPSGILVIALAALAATMQRFARLTIVALIVRLEFVFVAIALPGLAVSVVKRLIGRVRPSVVGPFAYVPFSWRPDYASMPSGHATTAFAVAVALGALWPRARPLLWLYAVVIAASRIIIAAHYPSDVIAGACVGGFAALIIRNYFAARRLGFVAAPDGTVRALPGPSLRRIGSSLARMFTPTS